MFLYPNPKAQLQRGSTDNVWLRQAFRAAGLVSALICCSPSRLMQGLEDLAFDTLCISFIGRMLKHKLGYGVAGGFNGPRESVAAFLLLKLEPHGIENILKPTKFFWGAKSRMALH
jgi:hypothetical protein